MNFHLKGRFLKRSFLIVSFLCAKSFQILSNRTRGVNKSLVYFVQIFYQSSRTAPISKMDFPLRTLLLLPEPKFEQNRSFARLFKGGG